MANVGHFPLSRLTMLLVRRLSSPISNRLKVCARHYPRFGTSICARAGRWYRACELRFKLWVLQLAGPRFPIAVSDREAIDIGTDILGEATIFALGSLIIIYEMNRQAEIQEARKLDVRSRWVAILTALEELKIELDIQEQEIDMLLAAIRELDPDVPLPLPSSLSKPLHLPDPITDPATPPPIPGQDASAALYSVSAPPLSSLPIPEATPDQATPLRQTSTSSPPSPHLPTVAPPASQTPAVAKQPCSLPDCRCDYKCGSSPPPPPATDPKPPCAHQDNQLLAPER